MSPEPQQRDRMPDPAGALDALSRTFLDSALDCIITMDATGRVQEFNPASERVFGFSRSKAVGKELAELIIPPRLRERHRQGLAHSLHRRLSYAGRPPVKSAILATDAAMIHYGRLHAVLTQGSPINVRIFQDRAKAAQWLSVPVEQLAPKEEGSQ